MNVPFKNITKADTSKGVPVWVTNLHDVRTFAASHNGPHDSNTDAGKKAITANMGELTEFITLVKTYFTNNRDIGSSTILLSIACLNFLSLHAKNAITKEFIDYIAYHKFGGVAYTGNSDKIVTVTRDDQVPAMLPFVLRDRDPIVAGYGVYLASVEYDVNEKDVKTNKFLHGIDTSKIKPEALKQKKKELFAGKCNTLYNDYVYELDESKSAPKIYILFSMRKAKVDAIATKYHNVHICTSPVLTIATHNQTQHSFEELGCSLALNVRATNSFGLVVTVATTGVQKTKRGSGTLSCETTGSAPKMQKTSTITNPDDALLTLIKDVKKQANVLQKPVAVADDVDELLQKTSGKPTKRVILTLRTVLNDLRPMSDLFKDDKYNALVDQYDALTVPYLTPEQVDEFVSSAESAELVKILQEIDDKLVARVKLVPSISSTMKTKKKV
jgi:hypothetical protein